jgi:hypothetical protein
VPLLLFIQGSDNCNESQTQPQIFPEIWADPSARTQQKSDEQKVVSGTDLYQGMTSVVPQSTIKVWALAPAGIRGRFLIRSLIPAEAEAASGLGLQITRSPDRGDLPIL